MQNSYFWQVLNLFLPVKKDFHFKTIKIQKMKIKMKEPIESQIILKL